MGFFKKMMGGTVSEQETRSLGTEGDSQATINSIKVLGIDMVAAANSGHPGIVLGAAPMAYTLFRRFMHINPKSPHFANRDRFVLSAGHGSALLYSLMHHAGYEQASMEELKRFRQAHSKTPGHPENYLMEGVESTTGPLGQGIANAVGMAIAESFLSAKYNVEGTSVFNHHTYALFGDGCLQEGVAQEAIALAGRFRLNKLIMLYDSNDVQLDGPVGDSTNFNVKGLFEAYGWFYQRVDDGASVSEIAAAIERAKTSRDRPSIIEIKTVIGAGSLKQGTFEVHGAPLEAKDVAQLKLTLNMANKPPFHVERACYDDFKPMHERGTKREEEFNLAVAKLQKTNPALHHELLQVLSGQWTIDENWFEELKKTTKDATRNTTGKVFDIISKHIPIIIGGSADLSGSTKIKGAGGNYDHNKRVSRNINYGVREHAMQAVNNGIALHGFCIPIGATFFNFIDYLKPALRLSSMMRIRSLQVFSHDSVLLGEDGPTHQPVEQLWATRLIPGHFLFRPANVEETIAAFKFALSEEPRSVSIVTSRLAFNYTPSSVEGALHGGYMLASPAVASRVTLVATGSEVGAAVGAATLLAAEGIAASVVSMPCVELFMKQDANYRNAVITPRSVSIAIEAGTTIPWLALTDHAIGIDRFGESAPGESNRKEFMLTEESIAQRVKQILSTNEAAKVE